jgi:hypothetical protein
MGFIIYLQNCPPTVQFVILNAKRARQVRPPKLQGYLPQRACPQCRERRSGLWYLHPLHPCPRICSFIPRLSLYPFRALPFNPALSVREGGLVSGAGILSTPVPEYFYSQIVSLSYPRPSLQPCTQCNCKMVRFVVLASSPPLSQNMFIYS